LWYSVRSSTKGNNRTKQAKQAKQAKQTCGAKAVNAIKQINGTFDGMSDDVRIYCNITIKIGQT
jgi:hypothetical protein